MAAALLAAAPLAAACEAPPDATDLDAARAEPGAPDAGARADTSPLHVDASRPAADPATRPVPPRCGASFEWVHVPVEPYRGVDLPILRDPHAVDALPETTLDYVAHRSYSSPIVGDDGIAYYRGGGHGSYSGSDTMVLDLAAIESHGGRAPWVQAHRPHTPAESDIGYYCCGYGAATTWYPGYPATQSSESAPGRWEPFGLHYGPRQSWHPVHGLVEFENPAVIGWDGATPIFAGGVLARFDLESASYEVLHTDPHPGEAGVPYPVTSGGVLSEHDAHHDAMLTFTTSFGSTWIDELAGGLWRRVRNVPHAFAGENGEQIGAAHYLESGVHLIYNPGYPRDPRPPAAAFRYDHRDGSVSAITLPPEVREIEARVSGMATFFAVDRASRVVYLLQGADPGAGPLLYAASFDALDAWERLDARGGEMLQDSSAHIGLAIKSLWYWNGHLYDFVFRPGGHWGAIELYRMCVG
jgi:hypothetical protein